MAKLHELLAAVSTVKGQADKCLTDLMSTFDKKKHLFGEKRVTFTPNTEGAAPVTEEQSDLQSTIQQELKWIAGVWTKAIDASFQVAEANTNARADVILDDGTTVMKGVPATALLELETRAGEIHALVSAIPTLDPAKGFKLDVDRGQAIFRAREITKPRTKKITRPIVLHPATPEHPAQVQLINEDVPTGMISELEWSGLITPAAKADMLSRAEELKRAFKTARSRANETAVTSQKVAEPLFAYVFGV